MSQYAAGRPNASDEAQLMKFANEITGKDAPIAPLSGNRPYKIAVHVSLPRQP